MDFRAADLIKRLAGIIAFAKNPPCFSLSLRRGERVKVRGTGKNFWQHVEDLQPTNPD
jgi:hypothetical protein